jgi:hypothetical protein
MRKITLRKAALKKVALSTALLGALFAAGVYAQPMPSGGASVTPAEVLASAPDLTATQQAEVRKILIQRRDAQEALDARLRIEFDALRTKERNERERIGDQSSEQLRKLLGDDGYRKFAEWNLSHRGPPGGGPGGRPPRSRGERGDGPNGDGWPPSGKGGAHAGAPFDESDD